ncbi:MAG: ImmA/IrrE family metallo-endopeptidase [Burkholderiaceae bacterium]|nr:ImmA/IrrE family metallo-endopeptidase [Sulfuritalea sp.]MCF8176413.1 ImmA/IrrE family metallo-endopeptidase [Burkholderiaceae bacterium]
MKLKLIKNESDYNEAMARLSALMAANPGAGSADENELDILALVVEDYERKIVPPVAPDPVEAILFRLDQAGLTRKNLIPYIGSAPKVSEVLARKRPLSLTMIRRLHHGLGIPAEVLIGGAEASEGVLEAPEIDYTRFPLKEMLDRGCFGSFSGNAARLKDYAEDLMREFLRGLSPNPAEPVLMRAPLHQRGDRRINEEALLAWRLCVLKKARAIDFSRDYKKGVITARWLRELARLSSFQEGPKLAREYLARAGIALVVEMHFKGTYLDGAAMLDQGRPIVALTLRHDRLDNFWFVVLHELAHVARHLNESHPFFADDLDSLDKADRQEAEADEMAQEALLPQSEWATFATETNPTASTAQAFADRLGIDPAIVAGRARHEQQNFRLLTRLLGQGQPSRQLVDQQGNP